MRILLSFREKSERPGGVVGSWWTKKEQTGRGKERKCWELRALWGCGGDTVTGH